MRTIIDAHAHVFPEKITAKATESIGEFYHMPMFTDGSVQTLLNAKKTLGISKFLIQSVATTPLQVESINNFIAEMVRQYPDTFIGFGALHPDMDDPDAEIERIVSLGLKGVKLHPDFQEFPADSNAAMKLYEKIAGRLPLLIHAGDKRYDYSGPKRIANLLNAFPQMDVIAAHFGGWSQWDEAMEHLGGLRVWVDTSSSLYELSVEKARELIACFGDDYVLFGTDFPMWKAEDELERIAKLGLSEEQLEKIFHLNAERLLKL